MSQELEACKGGRTENTLLPSLSMFCLLKGQPLGMKYRGFENAFDPLRNSCKKFHSSTELGGYFLFSPPLNLDKKPKDK